MNITRELPGKSVPPPSSSRARGSCITPRQPLRERRLSGGARGARRRVQHEPARQLEVLAIVVDRVPGPGLTRRAMAGSVLISGIVTASVGLAGPVGLRRANRPDSCQDLLPTPLSEMKGDIKLSHAETRKKDQHMVKPLDIIPRDGKGFVDE